MFSAHFHNASHLVHHVHQRNVIRILQVPLTMGYSKIIFLNAVFTLLAQKLVFFNVILHYVIMHKFSGFILKFPSHKRRKFLDHTGINSFENHAILYH